MVKVFISIALLVVAASAVPQGPRGPPPSGMGRPGMRPPPPGGMRPPPSGGMRPPCGQGCPRPPPANRCKNTNPEANKRMVLDFYQKVFGDKDFSIIDDFVANDVINHNPMEADGVNGLKELLQGPLGQGGKITIEFQRSIAEGDLVWTHSRFPAPALGTTFAIADIFRINCDGKIAEHWDVIQDTTLTEPSRNPHPFF